MESAPDDNNRKFYFSNLYLPKTCAPFMKDGRHRFVPEFGYLRKRESEGHVALLALKKLHKDNFLDDYLFPKIGLWDSQKQPNKTQNSPHSKKITIDDYSK